MMSKTLISLALCCLIGVLIFQQTLFAEEKEKAVSAAETFQLLEEVIQSWVDYERLPGVSLGIVKDQKLIFQSYAGYADPEKKIKADKSTKYSICSISKLFTSIGIMKLSEDGQLNISHAVSDYIPELKIKKSFPQTTPMNLKALLTHSSGLPREAGGDFWWPENKVSFPSVDRIIERANKKSTLYPINQHMQYSNLGMSLLGEVIQRVAKDEYSSYIQKNILAPLNMKDTKIDPSQSLYAQ
ncbi:MAG: serine hydrolase domain-containing protein, partial [Bacteroidota bacterium]